MNYRFEPTGEVRVPKAGEYYGNSNSVIQCDIDFEHVTVTIFRRVPHEDTSCEVAFARMWLAEFFAGTLPVDMEREYTGLKYRFANGERSPELTQSMTDLTQKMRGTP